MVLQSRVRRRARACARCRRLKVHCDALPSGCSACIKSQEPCVAVNSETQQAVPRSIAQFLETKVAERELAVKQQATSRSSGDKVFAGHVVNDLLDTITAPSLGLSSTVPFSRCVVAGTRLPSTNKASGMTRSDIHQHHPKSIINTHPVTTPLSRFPVSVADFLFDNYITRVSPQYPIHYTPDLTAMHKTAFHETDAYGCPRGPATRYDEFTLNLIMAISLSTAARSKQARANSIASGLFEKAMECIPEVLTNDLRGLQALVLLTQYTFLNPGVANFWLLTGFISQACIDLGLHQELPADAPITVLERDMRRRVFWCAWEMEMAVCGALLRPITLLRRIITTKFSSKLEDSAITDAGIDGSGRATKFTACFIWRYREIECDIISTLFHDEPLPASFPSLEQWMDHQEQAITNWNKEIHSSCSLNTDARAQSQWDEMQLYSDIATAYILVTLFRPCPRIKQPSADNLIKAFSAAVEVADGSWRQANLEFGSSKYVFHACYHSFSAAITFLQALQRVKASILAVRTWDQIESDMDTFSRFFATVAERWPAASRCLEEYERLLAPIKKEVEDFLTASKQQQESEMLTEEDAEADSYLAVKGVTVASLVGDCAAAPYWNDLDETIEALDYANFFNVMPPGLDDSIGIYPCVPSDWDEEFNFDALR
ncbi:hypothetical protein NLU13_4862 [Sarocladium strictum]|uniref:Zn(2)-C6 fungal-type domain-containing protein n=1 Tax=Sarocladium strictum TaxID=5046 RepID=A0AA39GKG9_SARSR|nr:hypothetical protein NLU13_4862 [Sarocladium strictum]